jgi:hypothetical protein
MSLINEALKRASEAQRARPVPQVNTPAMKPADAPRRKPWPSWLVPVGLVVLGIAGCVLIWQGFRNHTPSNVATVRSGIETPAAKPAPAAVPPPSSMKPSGTGVAPAVPSPARSTVRTPAVPPSDHTAPTPALAASKQATTAPKSNPEGPVPTQPASPALAAAPPSAPPITEPAASPSATIAPATAPTPPPVTSSSAEKTPAAPAPVSFPELKLQGIFYRLSNPTVLINGQTLGVGDSVAGVKIVKIERQNVVVEMMGQRKVIIMR